MTDRVRTRDSRRLLWLLAVSLLPGLPLSGQDTDPVVAETDRFEFRSDARVALHHFLIDWAAADQGEWPPYAMPIRERDDWRSGLSAEEQQLWSDAVETYKQTSGRSLLFDSGMLAVRSWAAGERGRDAVPEAEQPLAAAVQAAMSVYQRHWWPDHDAANRRWIEALVPTLVAVEDDIVRRMENAYGGTWPNETIPVDVMVYANPVGAYSTAGRLTMSSRDRGLQMPQALEMVFHEASHADPLEGPMREHLSAAFEAAGGEEPDRLWHDVIFYTSGEATRLALAARGEPGYEHYGSFGVYQRGERWRAELPAFEAHWRPFLESESAQDDERRRAFRGFVQALLGGS